VQQAGALLGLSKPCLPQCAGMLKCIPSPRCNPNTRSGREITNGKSFPTCRELGHRVVAYSPLGRGFLTGKLPQPEKLDAGDYRRTTPRFQDENTSGTPSWSDRIEKIPARKIAPRRNSLSLGSWPQEVDIVLSRHKRRTIWTKTSNRSVVTLLPGPGNGSTKSCRPEWLLATPVRIPIGMNRRIR